MRDNLLVQVLAVLFAFFVVPMSLTAAIVPKEITVEDTLPWTDEDPDPAGEVADWNKRIFHFIADGVLFMQFQAVLLEALLGDSMRTFPSVAATSLAVAGWILYYPVMEYITGKTIAKFITQTRVVGNDGVALTPGGALGRSLCRLVPFDALTFLKEYPVGWHDELSGTYVINAPSPAPTIPWEEQ